MSPLAGLTNPMGLDEFSDAFARALRLRQVREAPSLAVLEQLKSPLGISDFEIYDAYIERQSELLQKDPENGHANHAWLLQEIGHATDIVELQQLFLKRQTEIGADYALLEAYSLKLSELREKMIKEVDKLKRQVSTFVSRNGEVSDELTLSDQIKARCPKNTYTQIIVTTLASYQFPGALKKARKIELIRTEWGFLKVPLFEGVQALFSSAFATNSIYREVIESNLVMCGLLASSLVVGDEQNGIPPNQARQAEFETQMRAAYWSGKKIEIVFPVDLSESGSLKFISQSKILTFSINSGKFLRNLFTNK